ncbi:hypothetical protein DC498_24940 [Terrimonas sp.]|uniref:hypothetical protein n=1 Tax=Terrimonas sp. TaxID=1914338 RepID=UPI000D5173DF|nr:hypothetical protein [Terrimonas sp.]PVD49467.1 hypothetical protein DC498_24940 [Terrimonas sp.]
MRKNIFLPIIVVLAGLSGCTKVWDYFIAHPGHPARKCRIEKITFNEMNPDNAEEFLEAYAYFAYNTNGHPSSIEYYTPFVYPLSDRLNKGFAYDEMGRLRVYTSDSFITFWHLYTYTSPTKITDSVFVYSSGDYTVNDHPDTYVSVRVSHLTLDMFGRIIKEETIEESGYTSEKTFVYNTDGNLIIPDVTYSGKPNIRQTNKIWQFIDRNYSVNQPRSEVAALNAYGLPYIFRSPISSQSEVLAIAPGAVVTYNCD